MHKASLGRESHVPTALPQAQVNKDPGTGGLAAATDQWDRCDYEVTVPLTAQLVL